MHNPRVAPHSQIAMFTSPSSRATTSVQLASLMALGLASCSGSTSVGESRASRQVVSDDDVSAQGDAGPSGCEGDCADPPCTTGAPCVSHSGACAWGLDDLLAEVDVEALDREDCGATNGGDTTRVSELLDCFAQTSADPGAQFTVNNCIDCLILSHYVKTPSGDTYHVYMESDVYGDSFREARVEHCASIEQGTHTITCVETEVLYECTEARPAE